MKAMTPLLLFLVLALSSASVEVTATCYGYPLVYNFYDMLAQSVCTAKYTGSARVWAMRRSDPVTRKSCDRICAEKSLSCFQTYYVYKNPSVLSENSNSQPDEGVPGLSMHTYTSGCGTSGGGPNYCCCAGPENALGN